MTDLERAVADFLSLQEFVLSNPAISERDKDRFREWAPSLEDHRTIRRFVFDRLPTAVSLRKRVASASSAGWRGTIALVLARKGFGDREVNAYRRKQAEKVNEARARIVSGTVAFVAGGKQLDGWTLPRLAFSTALNLRAKAHGLKCSDGFVSDAILAALGDVALIFQEPFPVPERITRRTKDAASRFDIAVAVPLQGVLSTKATARLIAELRTELKLPPSTAGAIEQRIRDARNR